MPDAAPLGRQPVLEALTRSRSAALSGWVGSGRTALLHLAGDRRRRSGSLVLSATVSGARRPFGYLESLVAGLVDSTYRLPAPGDARLAEVVEAVAAPVSRVACGRRVVLLLDDLHAADDASLAVLPFVRRRLAADPLVAVRVPPGAGAPPPAVARAVDALEPAVRLRLPPLSRRATADVIRALTGRVPHTSTLDRLDAALGTAAGHPGLVRAVQPGGRLRADHPLVTELADRPAADRQLLAASTAGPGLLTVVEAVARRTAEQPVDVAAAVDRLAADGWLLVRDDTVLPAIPAVASAVEERLARPGAAAGAARRSGRTRPPHRSRPADVPASAELLDLLALGLSNDAVGARLGVSAKTVERRVSRLLTLHGCANRTELVARALTGRLDATGR